MELDYLLFTERDILERVDEYTLYCFYLGYEPLIGAKYSSPLRSDTSPSWGIFEPTRVPTDYEKGDRAHEFLWKDNGTGRVGNIFNLIQAVYGYGTTREALMKVCADFNLGGTKEDMRLLPIKERRYVDPVDIAVASKPFTNRDLQWWKQFHITKDILDMYTTTAVKHYWIAEWQRFPSYPHGLGYAYREYDKYQLYFPQAGKKDKFRTNYTDVCVHGFRQLCFNSELCIITKSRKDVMCLRAHEYDAVSPRSETTMLPAECIAFLQRKYKEIRILFDNDQKKNNAGDYPFPSLVVPPETRSKDVSDHNRDHGPYKTSEMLKKILQL